MNHLLGGHLFSPLDAETRRLVDALPSLIDKTFPLPRRFRSALPRDVAELSGLLTYERRERREDYLNRPPLLSAYLRYFLPWNVYRLARLLPALSLPLKDGDAVTDLGSGPLTLPLALWIARRDLREVNLEFRCLDKTASALEAGKRIFTALAGDSPWRIKTIHGVLGDPIRGPRAALVMAGNVFNEAVTGNSAGNVKRQGELLVSLAAPSGSIFVVEPGIPSSGDFIAGLRAVLSAGGFPPRSPCPQEGPCPLFDGKQGALSGGHCLHRKHGAKWCHFVFDTRDAPQQLLRLSASTGIPKERAALSFLLAGASNTAFPPGHLPVRIISDAFPLTELGGQKFGRYGCSAKGLILAAGEYRAVEALASGALAYFPSSAEKSRDPKSGALIYMSV